MSAIDKVVSAVTAKDSRREPAGTIHVVDPSPLNWLYITYNTVEELVRVDRKGGNKPAAMSTYSWADDRDAGSESSRGRALSGRRNP